MGNSPQSQHRAPVSSPLGPFIEPPDQTPDPPSLESAMQATNQTNMPSSPGSNNRPPNQELGPSSPVQEATNPTHVSSPLSSTTQPTNDIIIWILEQQILKLVDTSSDSRIDLCKLPAIYNSTYGYDIAYKEHGFQKLSIMLGTFSSISVMGSGGGTQWYIISSNGPLTSVETHSIAAEDIPLVANEGEELDSESSWNTLADYPENAETSSESPLPASTTVPSDGLTSTALENKGTVDFVDDKDVLLSLTKAAATDLTSTKMHRDLLALLAEHPDGLSCSQVKKSVKGLTYYIHERSKAAGTGFFSPSFFLSHCEGVKLKQVANRKLLFLDSNEGESESDLSTHSSVEASGYDGTTTVDGAAAVELLKLLQNKYQRRPWPNSKKQLNQFLLSLDQQASPSIAVWLQQGLQDGLTASKRNKEAIKRAMYQLKKMGCLSGTNKSLVWNHGKIRAIVERDSIKQPSSDSTFIQLESANIGSTNSLPVPVGLIDTTGELERVLRDFPFNPLEIPTSGDDNVVAIDCEGVPNNIFLLQVGTCTATYVFDCVKLGAAEVCKALAPLFTGSHVIKLFHDLHNDAAAIYQIGGVALCHTLDTQLAIEALTGDLHIGFNPMLRQLGQSGHPLKQTFKQRMHSGDLFVQRPIPPDVIEYAALDVSLLIQAKYKLFDALGAMRDSVQRASDTRAKMAPESGGARKICFDVANSYSISSLELMQELRPDDMLKPIPLVVSDDTHILLEMLPEDLRKTLFGQTQHLSDIVLDKGREPLAWVKGERVHLGAQQRVVSEEDIHGIVERLGGFGNDNRAGLEQQLHRVSAMRNRQEDIIGLTLRVGRHVSGNAAMISDLLFSDCTKSILFLGEPGSGKTTVVREVTRQLAERFNVCIVDTSNEIAGDGDIPHPCVGYARRMMVPSLDKQSSVMVECVQNHTPEVMVIDEIGRPTEVEAARTCKQRGVRLIASAHGDLRKLIKNPKLRGLVGGVETVTLGDAEAKAEAKKTGKANGSLQKLKAQRAGSPTFDIIVELRRGAQHEWRIVLDTGDAVDKVLEGDHYLSQLRTRDPETGTLSLDLDRA